jgi:hypothetical protein
LAVAIRSLVANLTMVVTSRTALSPRLPPAGLDLSIVVGGKTLADPYSTVMTITNSGAKPILAGEIEGDIAVTVGEATPLVQAQVAETYPASLTPMLAVTSVRFN